MFRSLIRFLGIAFLAGLIIPPIAALMTKRRLAEDGRGAFTPEANDLDTALIFEGGEYASKAPSFTGGELLTWYGGGRLDLRDATIAPGGADLRIRAIFGGVQLIVPKTWRVEVDVTPILGGIANGTTAPADPGAPVLRVSALAVFGGVAISNEPGESMFEADFGKVIRNAREAAREAADEATDEFGAGIDEATAEVGAAADEAMEAATADKAG
ncbi:MAG: LiaF domain-containing protein [Candidatus Limnocylindrales bacterium]